MESIKCPKCNTTLCFHTGCGMCGWKPEVSNCVNITMQIPFPIDKPGINGVTFSSKCLDGLMASAVGKPITMESGEVVGQITKALSFNDDALLCEGILFTNGFVTSVLGMDPIETATFQEYIIR